MIAVRYALISPTSNVVGLDDMNEQDEWRYPPGFTLIQCDGWEPEHPYYEYVYDGGQFSWVEPTPTDLTPEQVIKSIYTAMPALTVGIIDKLALRMMPYLPDYDPSTTYTVGMLAIKDDVVQRRTIGGWRIVE